MGMQYVDMKSTRICANTHMLAALNRFVQHIPAKRLAISLTSKPAHAVPVNPPLADRLEAGSVHRFGGLWV